MTAADAAADAAPPPTTTATNPPPAPPKFPIFVSHREVRLPLSRSSGRTGGYSLQFFLVAHDGSEALAALGSDAGDAVA